MQQQHGRCARALTITAVLLLAACGSSSTPVDTGAAGSGGSGGSGNSRPNVVVILADDVGYGDIGAFGSEIKTPNLDALAASGVLMTNFHTTSLCATSRAELLTGADHHLVGMGTLPDNNFFYLKSAAYNGGLNDHARTVANILHDAGYHTYMAGKWHLGGGGPQQQGFEHSFSLDYAAAFASNFVPKAGEKLSASKPYFEDGVEAAPPADTFFSSDYFVERLQSYIGADHGDGKPFFAYLAFQATHFPLQVPDAYRDLYKGQYDAGYAVIRDQRLQRQKDLGLIPQDFKEHPGDEAKMTRFGQPGPLTNKSWDALSDSDKQSEARIMEIYAGMMTNLDDNVGKLVAYLKQIGEYDNTFIVFMGDNGSDGMGYGFIPYLDGTLNADIDNSYDNYGKRSSFLFRSTRWAEVGTVPFRLFKSFTAEGGISVPAIAHLPAQYDGKVRSTALSSLRDIVPTVLDLVGTGPLSDQYDGNTVAMPEGMSLLPALEGKQDRVHGDDEVIVDEVNDIRYVRKGPWKATRIVNYLLPSAAFNLPHGWQLYNMDSDRGETTDLASTNPDKLNELIGYWQDYVARVGVQQPLIPPILTPIND